MATTATIRVAQETVLIPTLFLAFALGANPGKRGGPTGAAPRPRERHGPAGDGPAVLEERRRATSRLGLPAAARVVRGDAAGRAGCWLHRFFVSQGVAHGVVDSASLAGQRRDRRAQTERLEGHTLRTRLGRQAAGAKKVWSGVRVPRVGEADRRQWHRALRTTQRARTRGSNRIKGLRAGCGMRLGLPGEGETHREAGRQGDGPPWPAAWRARLQRAWPQVPQRTEQSGSLEAERRVAWRTRAERVLEQVRP